MRVASRKSSPARPIVRIGCSGFMYDHWRGPFYASDLPKRSWFEYYRRHFDTVEMNVTFYRLPKPETMLKWYKESPYGYTFALKGSRFITHVKRLAYVEEAVARFFEVALKLREKLAVILWQFPPGFSLAPDRLATFIDLLAPHEVRQAFEFRDESWMVPEVAEALRLKSYALAGADWPPWNREPPVTSNFVYLRRHGPGVRCDSGYTEGELKEDARSIRRYLKQGCDVFIYFNNDAFGHAPKDAARLKALLSP